MKTHKHLLITILCTILLVGCKSTGEKALQKGDYYTACKQAVERLRSSPDNKKAINALAQAYPLALTYTDKEVERLLSSSYSDKNRQIFNRYDELNTLAIMISKCPAALKIIPEPNYYNQQLKAAREMAAEEAFQNAEYYMQQGTRYSAKKAYYLYLDADNLIPGYKYALSKALTAKWEATLKVVVEQEPVGGAYKISADFFQNKVFEYLSKNIRNEFIKIYSPEEAEQTKLVPNQIIRMQFLDFVVGQIKQTNNIVEVSRDSVIVGTIKDKRGNEHDVYGTVKAKLSIKKAEILSSGILNMTIVEYPSNKIIDQQRFPGTFIWVDQWGTFNGDERALTDEEYALCEREPSIPPPPQEMFVQFTLPIYNSLASYFQNFYKKY